MKVVTYTHNHGDKVVPHDTQRALLNAAASIKPPQRPDVKQTREAISDVLRTLGWSSEIPVVQELKLTITATLGKVGLCLQTGNMARLYADLLKLQVLYERRDIECAIFILFTKHTAGEMGDNLANFERLAQELPLYQNCIAVPILVVGLEGG